MILPALHNDYRAVERYRHRPGPPGQVPITALIGEDDPRTRTRSGDYGPFRRAMHR